MNFSPPSTRSDSEMKGWKLLLPQFHAVGRYQTGWMPNESIHAARSFRRCELLSDIARRFRHLHRHFWHFARLLRPREILSTVLAVSLMLCGCKRPTEQPATSSNEWREFEGSWNAVGTRRTIPLGIDRKGSIIELRGTMLLTGSGHPGAGFLAEIIALTDTETGLTGRGVWTDERGDQVFSELKGEGTKEHNQIMATIMGGTGRFVGATGSYEFSWQYVIESEDGSIQGRATGLKGRYRMEPRISAGATP